VNDAASNQPNPPGCRILVAGTGGQGVLTAARLLCQFFGTLGRDVVSGQVHGMAQRGGSVQSTVIVDAGESPVIPSGRADVVVGLEPVETVRALPLMSARTVVCMNTAPVHPSMLAVHSVLDTGNGTYPDMAQLQQRLRAVTAHVLALNARERAARVEAEKAMNMVMLGCLFASGALAYSAEAFLETIESRVPPKLRQANIRAFREGLACGEVSSAGGRLR